MIVRSLASRLTKNAVKSHSEACGCVRARISTAVVHATRLGSRGYNEQNEPTTLLRRSDYWSFPSIHWIIHPNSD